MNITIDLKILSLLILVIILGIITSWFDIKKRRIPNKIIVLFIIAGFILNITTKIIDFQINYLINILFTFFVGFFLWYVHFWNAGDGKLFLAFISLIPIELIFIEKYFLYSYNVIVYTFVPVFFVFLIIIFLQTNRAEFIHALKESMKLKTIFNIIIAFFAFQWIIQLIVINFGIRLNLFISAIILFFIFDGLEKILKIKLINLFYAISVLRLFIDSFNIFSLKFISYFTYQVFIFMIFVYFFLHIAYFKFGVHVKIPNLQPGMNLCEKIIKGEKKYTVTPDIKISLFMFLRDKIDKKTVIDIKPEGLTKEEINKIQNWNKAGKMEVGALLIQKRIPYAPFQFLGVILLIIINFMI